MSACLKCRKPLTGSQLICEEQGCGAIQPARGPVSPFEVFGLDAGFELELHALERRYKELSRKLHPDRFVNEPQDVRLLSLQRTTDLNQAYKQLRDPVKRGEVLLAMAGVDVTSETAAAGKADDAFLMEIMELREALADAQAASDQTKVDALCADVKARAKESKRALARALGAASTGISNILTSSFEQSALESAAKAVVKLRYFQRFLDELEREPEL